ncbi:ribonuclease HII [Mycotypha africana]|uniref:ribonuclease HII n=1 Tax=Mycotypha africana TaxID=64632 RepID=UPI002301016C|nr:ribonuclease HII [Mycotypha africana]KAI8988071.1 ribonuclease HII [Mycotypha africana]
MVYAISFCPLSKHKQFKEHGFDDSKKLTEEKRTELAKMIQKNKDWIGWAVYVLSPQDISANMFKRPVYNLNEMAHDATIKLIQHVVGLGIDIQTIYVDPVGPSNTYRKKLESYFPNVEIIVEPKADALYPIVSAASICAKVTRDQYMQHWQWTEPGLIDLSKKFGSGYPSDPATKEWLKTNQDAFFGFPSITRFSWSTIIKLMEVREPFPMSCLLKYEHAALRWLRKSTSKP